MKPFVDISTVNAVESMYRGRHRDPFGALLAGHLADAYAYSDAIQVPFTTQGSISDQRNAFPKIISILSGQDNSAVEFVTLNHEEPLRVRDELLEMSFAAFSAWFGANRTTVQRWLLTHFEDWVQAQRAGRVPHQYSYSVEKIQDMTSFSKASRILGQTPDRVLYAFDIVLRTPAYGALVPDGEYFLHHPIRGAIQLPGVRVSSAPPPAVAVSFAASVSEISASLSLQGYCDLLFEIREFVNELQLRTLNRGDIEPEVLREIAAHLRLRPRLTSVARVMAVASGMAGAAAGLGLPEAAIAGSVVSVLQPIYKGNLPRFMGGWKWLRWAMRWDLEEYGRASDGHTSG
jgi:hypothetical protein